MPGIFHDLEEFVGRHRACGELTASVTPPEQTGYLVRLECSCTAIFERWVTPQAADQDLLRSGLPCFEN